MEVEPPRFSPERERHVALMREIARAITTATGDAFVLKGGTALLLGYGLPRFSSDLDFDGRRPNTDLTRSIEIGMQSLAISAESLTTRKHTPTTKRYILHYSGTGTSPPQRLKIEASFRRADVIDEHEVATIDGIRMYKIERLAPLKIDAFLDRTLGRDVFDTAFLLSRFGGAVPNEQLIAIEAVIAELGEDGLLELMADDEILQAHDLERITIELVETVKHLRAARNL